MHISLRDFSLLLTKPQPLCGDFKPNKERQWSIENWDRVDGSLIYGFNKKSGDLWVSMGWNNAWQCLLTKLKESVV